MIGAASAQQCVLARHWPGPQDAVPPLIRLNRRHERRRAAKLVRDGAEQR